MPKSLASNSCQFSHRLPCEIVWVSTMPRGKIASCRNDGGGHKPLNSAATKCCVCLVIPSARDQGANALSFLSLRNQSADWLWQSHGTTCTLRFPRQCAHWLGMTKSIYLKHRQMWGLLAAEPAFAFAGTRSRSVTVRSFGYEPPSCQYGGWTVAAVRKTENLLCVFTHDLALERKNARISP